MDNPSLIFPMDPYIWFNDVGAPALGAGAPGSTSEPNIVQPNTWHLANIGITQQDIQLGIVLGVLIILTAFGGILGNVGYWGMVLLGIVALFSAYHKGLIP